MTPFSLVDGGTNFLRNDSACLSDRSWSHPRKLKVYYLINDRNNRVCVPIYNQAINFKFFLPPGMENRIIQLGVTEIFRKKCTISVAKELRKIFRKRHTLRLETECCVSVVTV